MNTAATLAVAILGYRARSFLAAGTLDSIREAAGRVEGMRTRLIYLDNYSRDGSVQWLLDHAPDVDVLLAPRNELYCRGTNILLQYAARRYDPDFYLLVDADNYADTDAYATLVRFMERHPDHGIVQPLVRSRNDPSLLYSCGHRYTADHWCLPRKELPADRAELLDLESCSISSTLVRAEVFRRVGLLDPIYEIYYESSDLCFRARRAGFRCACEPAALTFNEGTEAVGPDSMHHRYYFNRNRLIFWLLNDEQVFGRVRAACAARLKELNSLLAASKFGLDALDESIRRGLEAGLAVTSDLALRSRPPVPLDGYEKTSAVLMSR